LRLQDAAGHVLAQGEAGPSGLGQGVDQAWRHVRQALTAAFAAAARPEPPVSDVALGLGLAGAGVAAQRADFLRADPGFAACALVNDGITQLLGACGGGRGIVVAAGTGSVAAARDTVGRHWHCGGWGFPVGDEGSGAWLGLRAMAHAQAVLDGRQAAGALSAGVLAVAGPDAQALLAWCAQAGQRAWAGLAPVVFIAAEAGDAVAASLLQQAATELASLVDALQRRMEEEGVPEAAGLPVVVRGSIGERLQRLWPSALRARLVPAVGDSADGALLLVRALLAGRELVVAG
jgi:glucosamine kinase